MYVLFLSLGCKVHLSLAPQFEQAVGVHPRIPENREKKK